MLYKIINEIVNVPNIEIILVLAHIRTRIRHGHNFRVIIKRLCNCPYFARERRIGTDIEIASLFHPRYGRFGTIIEDIIILWNICMI